QLLGRAMYYFVFIAQAIMVALITPAITSGAVTIEREQRSYELLVTTPLRPADLIRGKLTAAVSFVVLLLTASLPLVSLSFLVGGVSPAEIFFSYVIVALSAYVYGCIGIFWSATLRTTAAATVVTYLTVLSIFVLTLFPGILAQEASNSGVRGASVFPFQSINPVMATFRAVQPEYFFNTELPSWLPAAVLNLLVGMLIANLAMGRLEHFEPPRPAWTRLCSTLLWCAFCLALFAPVLGGLLRTFNRQGTLDDPFAAILIGMLFLVCIVTPVFNTGDLFVRRGESALRRYLKGFLPHRAFGNDLSSGFPLVMGWTLFLLALIPIAIVFAGKQSLFDPGALYLKGALVVLAVAIGLAGIGNILSVLVPSRWAACVLTYLAAVVLMLLPHFVLFSWYPLNGRQQPPAAVWQLLYLLPYEAMQQISTAGGWVGRRPPLLFEGIVPFWLVTTLFYLCVGAACFAWSAFRIRQVGDRLQQKMETAEQAFHGAAA
ncbi:MAG TPA: ABC transporter permease subunit, partial [Armatimonadota bacterium]|nr:ABC transporter permease subunit [Armatimonadota bacterium]